VTYFDAGKRMVQSRHIVVLLLAAALAGCGGYTMVDPGASFASSSKPEWLQSSAGQSSAPDQSSPATTGSTASQANQSDSAQLNSLFARAASGSLYDPAPTAGAPVLTPATNTVVADAGDTAAPATLPPAPAQKVITPRGRAYLFRGIAGLIYSRGMDKLEERIEHIGLTASVDTYLVWRGVVTQAIADYRRDPQPIVLIGHSMGGDSAVDFAEALKAQNIPVSLLVTYDP
jgi:hypothetical protein